MPELSKVDVIFRCRPQGKLVHFWKLQDSIKLIPNFCFYCKTALHEGCPDTTQCNEVRSPV